MMAERHWVPLQQTEIAISKSTSQVKKIMAPLKQEKKTGDLRQDYLLSLTRAEQTATRTSGKTKNPMVSGGSETRDVGGRL